MCRCLEPISTEAFSIPSNRTRLGERAYGVQYSGDKNNLPKREATEKLVVLTKQA
jgi:hypothetical protein